jgi:hypothetical protein
MFLKLATAAFLSPPRKSWKWYMLIYKAIVFAKPRVICYFVA